MNNMLRKNECSVQKLKASDTVMLKKHDLFKRQFHLKEFC